MSRALINDIVIKMTKLFHQSLLTYSQIFISYDNVKYLSIPAAEADNDDEADDEATKVEKPEEEKSK